MRPLIIGTAGHVDHGKTALTRALTGVDTDRLAEEKRRGLTIELGFAPLDLPGGRQASIVDVPGHEKFVPTMLSGAAGMDLVLLAVAADEGVMPQTREHLEILSLLGVRGGVLVLTKADRADGAQLDRVGTQVRAAVKGTFLETAPMAAVSAVTGQGIEELRSLIAALAESWPEQESRGPFRLHVDRAFSVEGSGTVVTGTLTGGPLRRGDTAELCPAGLSVKVRGLQRHGAAAEVLEAGTRAAVNLAGVRPGQVHRGDTLAAPGSLVLTDRVDVSLRLPAGAPFPVKNNSQLHLYHGARALICRCVLLGQDVLEPGQSGFAQLRLTQPLAALPGDRFVVRFFSPACTVGGGVFLHLSPPLRGRNDPVRTAALEVLDHGPAEARAALLLEAAGLRPQTPETLARDARIAPAALPAVLTGLNTAEAEGWLLSAQALDALEQRAAGLLERSPGLNGRELLSRLFQGQPPGSEGFLRLLTRRLGLESAGGALYLPGTVSVPDGAAAALAALYEKAGLCPPSNREAEAAFPAGAAACRKAGRALVDAGALTALSPQYRVESARAAAALDTLRARFGGDPFTLAQARDALGISRKYALLFLEYWDKLGITRKTGDWRVFR